MFRVAAIMTRHGFCFKGKWSSLHHFLWIVATHRVCRPRKNSNAEFLLVSLWKEGGAPNVAGRTPFFSGPDSGSGSGWAGRLGRARDRGNCEAGDSRAVDGDVHAPWASSAAIV